MRDSNLRLWWSTPILRDFLIWRKEAEQSGTGLVATQLLRRKLNKSRLNRKKVTEGTNFRWAIKTSAPRGREGESWGDVYFANDLANALRGLGQHVRVDSRNDVFSPDSTHDDVVLVIRGLDYYRPQKGAINLLWVISHPERVCRNEISNFDITFAASLTWPEEIKQKWGLKVLPLLQATNPERFNPSVALPDSGAKVLFIGNSRGVRRQIVLDAIEAKLPLTLIGRGWDKFINRNFVSEEFANNAEIPQLYRKSHFVLNDHWDDMRTHNFISNRLFDAVSAGARVISDKVDGLYELFGNSVQTYDSLVELKEIATEAGKKRFGSDEEIARRASRVGEEQSFTSRAEVLLEMVRFTNAQRLTGVSQEGGRLST